MLHFKKRIKIGKAIISEDSPVFIIAEAGVNHNGNMKLAKKLIDVACEAGADAVKFQAFKTENLIIKDVPKAPYQQKTTGSGESQFNMLKKLELTKDRNYELMRYCKRKKIIFLTTPFDEESLDELDDFDLPAYKISSSDLTNLPFLKKVAARRKPIFLSTGMSYMSEVKFVLSEIWPINRGIVLLQCSVNYPIGDEEANLNVINVYRNSFDILVGYSDHSLGIGASPYAVAMGAKVIEKHFTLDKNIKGPDHKASLSPEELKILVKEIRKVEKYLGSYIKAPTPSEKETRKFLQKCLVAAKEIKKEEYFTEKNVVAKRTGGCGISPIRFDKVIGLKATKNFIKDEIIKI